MATIRDVARAAGVSVATVSRVLNNHARVRTETRSRVTAAATELDYTPNEMARSLITSRTHAFGVLLPDLYGEFFSEVLRGIDLRARQDGFHLLVSSSHANGDDLVGQVTGEPVGSHARAMGGRAPAASGRCPDRKAATTQDQPQRRCLCGNAVAWRTGC